MPPVLVVPAPVRKRAEDELPVRKRGPRPTAGQLQAVWRELRAERPLSSPGYVMRCAADRATRRFRRMVMAGDIRRALGAKDFK